MTAIKVEGMSCGHCASAVKKAVAAADPGAQVEVDIPSGRVDVRLGSLDAAR